MLSTFKYGNSIFYFSIQKLTIQLWGQDKHTWNNTKLCVWLN